MIVFFGRQWDRLGLEGPCSDCCGDQCTMNCGPSRPERRKDRCVRGHNLNDPGIVGYNPRGYRYCRECNRIVSSLWKARKAAAKHELRVHGTGMARGTVAD